MLNIEREKNLIKLSKQHFANLHTEVFYLDSMNIRYKKNSNKFWHLDKNYNYIMKK